MMSNFACIIKNLSNSLDSHGEIKLEHQDFYEISSDNIEDINLPDDASAVILFKNEIAGHEEGGMPVITKFNPKAIKQYVITTEPFLNLPALLARFRISGHSVEGFVGAYVLRDGTLFLVNDEMKAAFKPILVSSLSGAESSKNSKSPIF